MVEVRQIDSQTFEVTVTAKRTTRHRVTLDDAYWKRVAGQRVDKATLIERSFEFLLEREPNTSILERFPLTEIARYFPEYEVEIKTRL